MENDMISSSLMLQWEREAMVQGIRYQEFPEFLRMKQRNYEAEMWRKERDKISAEERERSRREKMEREMVRKMAMMNPVELVVKNIKFEYDELVTRAQRGFKSDNDRENFIDALQIWYASTVERMKRDRITKEDMKKYRLNWKQCQRFYFSLGS